MSSSEETSLEPVQLPVAPATIRTAALAELERLGSIVQGLSLDDWSKRSAVTEWSLGDVVAHINLALGLYARLLDSVIAGKGAGGAWKTFGRITKRMAPVAGPAFNAINNAIPRVIDRALSPEVIKAQFVTSSRTVRDKLDRVGPNDYSRPVYYMGGPWPLSFFLGAMVNELAIHGWDIASRLDPHAHLSAEARAVLPWFYASGTPFMLHVPAATRGTVQAKLSDPDAEIWWTLTGETPQTGAGAAQNADATITGASGTFVLVLSGRISVDEALRSTSIQIEGNTELGRAFLGGWKIV